MAGMTEKGFLEKRLSEIINDLNLRAVEIFKDLLEDEDDFVDTSSTSTIGRINGLVAVEIEKLWQQLGFTAAALDPDSATDNALDVIGKLQGVPRRRDTYSTVSAVLEGVLGTTIPRDSVIYSQTTGNEFTSIAATVLDNNGLVSVTVEPLIVDNSVTYSFRYVDDNNIQSIVSYTSPSTNTTSSIVINGLANEVTSHHPTLRVESISSTQLKIRRTDIYNTANFSVIGNLMIVNTGKMASFRSVEYGAIGGEALSITGIKTPVTGWQTVYNPTSVTRGVTRENDEDYRYRLERTKMTRGTNLADTLYSALNELSGVESVTIYENESNMVDEKGLPAHSFMPVVLGGDTQEIAETIWNNEPAGIASHGSSSAIVYDAQSFPQTVRFQRPSPINIYVKVTVTKESDLYPLNAADAIKNNIVNWAEEEYGVGDKVIATRIYTPINQVQGHSIDSVLISTSPNPTSSDDLIIGFTEIAKFSIVNIDVVENL